MPDAEPLIASTAFFAKIFKPAVITWNRLEGRPRQVDFDRSLKAEVRDPYWMLCRQWQFGEFRGEDAGSAVKAKVQIESSRINRYAPSPDSVWSYDDNMPLEVRVERESIPMTLATRVQTGRHFSRLLGAAWAGVRDAYLGEYSIGAPTPDSEAEAHLLSDVQAHAFLTAVSGRVVDGGELLSAIGDGRHDTFVSTLGLSSGEESALRTAGTELSEWIARLFSIPAAEEPVSWRASRLEYDFTCAAPADQNTEAQLVLRAKEYAGGHLDWSAFDLNDQAEAMLNAETEDIDAAQTELRAPISFIPAPIEYGGMPNVRWWQFEDRKTDFGQINAATTDLALLMLAEFGLIYGNDWSLVPYDLPVGSLNDAKGVVITDVFGVRTYVRKAATRDDESWQHWNMYNLTKDPAGGVLAPYLLLSPAIGQREEGTPIEAVTLLRDEMANMVFGIETQIPGEIGDGVGGAEAAQALKTYFEERALAAGFAEPEVEETGAAIRYVAGIPTPENWIPFVATRLPGSDRQVRLQRGRIARVAPLAPNDTVEPRGDILRHGLDQDPREAYYIHEEEVPRAGARVVRAFQRTRWYDGRVYTWLGRSKTVGRGEGESGLRFDQIAPREPEAADSPAPADPE